MFTIYVYVLNTLADWELGYVTAELNSRRFFKKDAKSITLKTVSHSGEPIRTMGGITIVPDCRTCDIEVSESSVLLLAGADTWSDAKHSDIINKAGEILNAGGVVAAICGATVALSNAGLLDNRKHTSNGAGFLEMFSPSYKGVNLYLEEPSVSDKNLITASSTGGLLWAKQIIELLAVFEKDTLEVWYDYFSTGKPEYFYALLQTLPEQHIKEVVEK